VPRSASLRPAAVVLSLALSGASGACAHSSANALAPTRAGATGAGPADAATAATAAEAQRALKLADGLRTQILDASDFTEVGDSGCAGGALRTFVDTTAAGRKRVEQTFDQLERLVIGMGVDTPLDTPEGRALLGTVVTWEAGGEQPRWDVKPGGPDKRAIAPGLGGKFRNPETGKCETYAEGDTTTIVIPPVPNFAAPKLAASKAVLYQGDSGLDKAREAFFASVGARDTGSVFNYTRIRAAVIWGDYAVVAVNRPAERRGVQQLQTGGGGASYIFHRASGEWRLLAISRTWV
jgi:hypothetical protein